MHRPRAVDFHPDNYYEAEMQVEAKDTFSAKPRAKLLNAKQRNDGIPSAARNFSAFIACARPRVPSVFLPDMVSAKASGAY